ncbi:MAG: AAA family ATPase [Proteobacteria bacterium]|nr:AAA family ATPase [Pseudomonadota bacterium]
MFNLYIHNFGPIKEAEINIQRLEILIGPQSSGKSTIAKLVYFFLNIRDEVISFILEMPELNTSQDFKRDLEKRLRNRFIEFFGSINQPSDAKMRFTYAEGQSIELLLDNAQNKYLSVNFSPGIWEEIEKLFYDSIEVFKSLPKQTGLFSISDYFIVPQGQVTLLIRTKVICNMIFGFDKKLFYIPAGRSLLSTLSDKMRYIHPDQLDFPMRRFVDSVNNTRVFFDKSLDDLIQEREALSTKKLNIPTIKKAQDFVTRILRGEYRYDKEGGEILIPSGVYTKLSFASSGQQEVVWILLSLFFLVLENSKTLVFIEEPEAHLFPTAQKEIMDFIAFVFNELSCDFIITTHSPYLLSCVNNLLYAHELGHKMDATKIRQIIPEEQWLNLKDVGGYFVNDGKITNLLNEEVFVLKTELIDEASTTMNIQYDELLDVERKYYDNK